MLQHNSKYKNSQHNTGLQLNRSRTKPITSYNQTHNIGTHTYRQLQAITTNTCTQSANSTQSQPAQKRQFITVLPLYDGRRGSKKGSLAVISWIDGERPTGQPISIGVLCSTPMNNREIIWLHHYGPSGEPRVRVLHSLQPGKMLVVSLNCE